VNAAVPFLDLRAAHAELAAELEAASRRVLASGRYVLGPELEQFEREFAAYCGVSEAVGVGNGLEALVLILRASGIGPGDEVIVPAHTFIATWLAVTAAGARPVPADVRADTGNIDPSAVAAAITGRTRAVVAVHLHGVPAEMPALAQLASRHGLRLIEDAAQAHGARCQGRRCGGLADAAAFSFYPGKNLGALGDGGAVATNDTGLAARVRRLRNYGSTEKYRHDELGGNSRLDELQAAFLRAKLPSLDAWNERRRQVAQHYLNELRDIDGLRLPRAAAADHPCWHLFPVRHAARDALRSRLAQAWIETQIHYPEPPFLSGAYASHGWRAADFPVAAAWAAETLSLPIGPHLSTAGVATVTRRLRELLTGAATVPAPPAALSRGHHA
jgi:dTDP-3-amino-3,4,6-trideoxy-alpha-D-glucose transaminase